MSVSWLSGCRKHEKLEGLDVLCVVINIVNVYGGNRGRQMLS